MIQPYLALAGRIQTELKELEPVLERAETLSQKARRSADDDYLDGAALNVHSFYVGVEHILEEIARGLDGSAPTGPRWHQDLLIQMSAEIPGLRPPVLRRETRLALDEYRGFRHIVRHVYAMHIKPHRVQELATALRPVYEQLAVDLDRFCRFLQQMSEADE